MKGSILKLNICVSLLIATAALAQTPGEYVGIHNAYRANLKDYMGNPTSSPALVWSDSLAALAQDWATRQAASGAFEHRPKTGADSSPSGENLARGSAGYTAKQAIDAWVLQEVPNFDAAKSRCKAGTVCGHYTQVISQLSTELGCGTATGDDGSVTVVCNYNPHGNLVENGAYAELYPGQRAPVPGGAVFSNLNARANLSLMFNQCLTDLATAFLASTPNQAMTPQTAACGFNTVRAYDSGTGWIGFNASADTAGGLLIASSMGAFGSVMGTSGGVAVRLNPARAVVITGE